jgi:heme exporter protein C
MSAVQEMPTTLDKTQPGTTQPRTLTLLTIGTVITVVIGLFLALGYAATDAVQGEVQRIFYIHMPAFFGALAAFGATVFGGIMYLRTRQVKWDTLALAGVEVGLLLSLVNLATGSIWARPIWNTWWTWDPRLTSAAIMVLTYAAYLMLRGGIENPETRRRFASIYGILAIVTAIITLVIIRVVPETIHPAAIGSSPQNAEGGFNMQGDMAITLIFNLVIWTTLVPAVLMWYRIRLQNRLERVNQMKVRLLSE